MNTGPFLTLYTETLLQAHLRWEYTFLKGHYCYDTDTTKWWKVYRQMSICSDLLTYKLIASIYTFISWKLVNDFLEFFGFFEFKYNKIHVRKDGIHSTCEWSCIPQIYREPWCKAGLLFKPNIINYISEWPAWDFSDGLSDPVLLGNAHLNSLSWADDFVLMSTSKTGLQNFLDNLQTYCCKWGLEVNTDKTKTITFSKRRVLLDQPLIFGDSLLEYVNAFNYLGFCIKHNNDTWAWLATES